MNNAGFQQPQQQQVQVNLKDARQEVCLCGGKKFIHQVTLHTVSALMSPTGKELTAQVPALVCIACGEPFIPGRKEIKDVKKIN